MARLNTRASSSTAAPSDDDNVRQLDQARQQNDQKLKSRFERIFRKYEHDFEGVGDEIDLHSGEIVVDNGHLQNMRDEADPGKSASSRFVRTFQEKLGHEEEVEGEDTSEEEEGDEEEDGENDGEGEESSGHDNTSLLEPFRALTRPPPRLAQLLVGGTDVVEDEGSSVETPTTTALLHQIPALQDSMSTLTGRPRRPTIDTDTIQALGTSIANQLAQLMAASSTTSKKRKRSSHSKSTRPTTDPVWDFPDINSNNSNAKNLPGRKRRKIPTPPTLKPAMPPPISSPPAASPGQRSLWAPKGRQPKPLKPAATPSLRRLRSSVIPSSAVKGADLRRCMNCSLTNSTTWHDGPHGGDLCVSCAKYYDLYGRMKPFDSPTPSVEEVDEGVEDVPEMSLDDPVSEVALDEPVPETSLDQPVSEMIPDESVPEMSLSEPVIAAAPEMEDDASVEASFVRELERHAQEEQVWEQHAQEEQEEQEEREPTLVLEPSQHAQQRQEEPPQSQYPPSDLVPFQPISPQHLPLNTPKPASRGTPITMDDDPGYVHETPQTYPANTSRQILSPKVLAYTDEEDALIIKLKEKCNMGWNEMHRHLPQRSLFSIQHRYARALHNADVPGRQLFDKMWAEQEATEWKKSATPGMELNWTQEQDELLLELREERELDWSDIASMLPTHSTEAVELRYSELVREAQLRRDEQAWNANAVWTAEEDALIVRLKEINHLAWHHVAERFGENRTMQGIQKRYTRTLAPDKRRRAMSDLTKPTAEESIFEADPELADLLAPNRPRPRPFERVEDTLIMDVVQHANGFDWEYIASHVPGRSVREVYNRYIWLMNNEVVKSELRNRQQQSAQPESLPEEKYQWRTYSPTPGQPKFIRRTDTPPNYDENRGESPTAMVSASVGSGHYRPFVQAEDDVIMQLKASHNASWEDIARRLPGRSVDAIAQRFSELLRAIPSTFTPAAAPHALPSSPHPADTSPSQQRTPIEPTPGLHRYTHQEDDLISRLRAADMSWEAMSPYFPNRTPASIKDHWHAVMKPRARKSLPAPTMHQPPAGLLRTALDNSRRRSDPYSRAGGVVARHDTNGYGVGDGDRKEDPIVLSEDDVEMAAASEQLYEEFRSSVGEEGDVVRAGEEQQGMSLVDHQSRAQRQQGMLQDDHQSREEPQQGMSLVDPQLLEMDRITMNERKAERLMNAAEHFAAEQNNPRIVQRIWEILKSVDGVEHVSLRQLVELTEVEGKCTGVELEWAFEAFDWNVCRGGDGRTLSGTVESPNVRSAGTEMPRKEKGKEKVGIVGSAGVLKPARKATAKETLAQRRKTLPVAAATIRAGQRTSLQGAQTPRPTGQVHHTPISVFQPTTTTGAVHGNPLQRGKTPQPARPDLATLPRPTSRGTDPQTQDCRTPISMQPATIHRDSLQQMHTPMSTDSVRRLPPSAASTGAVRGDSLEGVGTRQPAEPVARAENPVPKVLTSGTVPTVSSNDRSGLSALVPSTSTAQETPAASKRSSLVNQDSSNSTTEESLGTPSRPQHTSSELIRMAFNATQLNTMHLKNICTWVERNFDYYRTASPSWKSDIVKELRTNDDFEQCGNRRARPWRVRVASEPTNIASERERNPVGRERETSRPASPSQLDPDDDYVVINSDHDADADDDANDDEDSIAVKHPPKKNHKSRGKRTTDSAEDLQEYTPAAAKIPGDAVRIVPARTRWRTQSKSVEVQGRVPPPQLDPTIEIADSDDDDDVDDLAEPVMLQKEAGSQQVSSGKKVRFVDTVEVRGPIGISAHDGTPCLKKKSAPRAQAGGLSDDAGNSRGNSSSTAKFQTPARGGMVGKVPPSSPVFKKPAIPVRRSKSAIKAAVTATPLAKVAKSRLELLRRESSSSSTIVGGGVGRGEIVERQPEPETPKTKNWPRRYSTPTAIVSHRGSPALRGDRGVSLVDRFGFGRGKRVLETVVRVGELGEGEEGVDELA